MALTTGVEHRLSSKIKRSQERRAAEGVGSSGAALPHEHLRGAAKHKALLQHGRHHAAASRRQDGAAAAQRHAGAAQEEEEEEEDSEEDEGRGAAFGKAKGRAAQRPAAFSRSELLQAGAAAQQGKKRKRKGGGGGAAAAGS